MADSQLNKDIREKRAELHDIYGGMMSRKDLARELGYRDHHRVKHIAEQMGIPVVMYAGREHYETSVVAKVIVLKRGMG